MIIRVMLTAIVKRPSINIISKPVFSRLCKDLSFFKIGNGRRKTARSLIIRKSTQVSGIKKESHSPNTSVENPTAQFIKRFLKLWIIQQLYGSPRALNLMVRCIRVLWKRFFNLPASGNVHAAPKQICKHTKQKTNDSIYGDDMQINPQSGQEFGKESIIKGQKTKSRQVKPCMKQR